MAVVEAKRSVMSIMPKVESKVTRVTMKEKVEKLRSRGTILVSNLEEKSIFNMEFLADITSSELDGQCNFLHLKMGIDYAAGLMKNFETEVHYWLSNLEYNVPITRWQDYAMLKSYECPDEDIKRMYNDLFRRLKPALEQFGVEFDLARGQRVVIPHTRRIKKEHTEIVGNFKLEFGGYVLYMRPCLSSFAKAVNLLALLEQEENEKQ